MPTIEISERTFTELQKLAQPLVDTPDSVIQRLLQTSPGSPGPEPKLAGTTPRLRVRKGQKTPNQAFYGPIVKVLRDAGGRLPTAEAVDRVGELVADQLSEIDMQPLKSGELRWRNTARFARNDLVTKGKLRKDSDFGVWELNEAGA
jgi:hypothetical protein